MRAIDTATPDLAHRVDALCSLSAGCIANGIPALDPAGAPIYASWRGAPSPSTERFTVPVDPADSPGVSLMLFYLLMSNLISQAWTHPIALTPYMESPD